MTLLYYLAWFTLSLIGSVRLLLQKREPSSTIAWLLFVIAFPIIGFVAFFVFGPQRLERRAVKRKQEIESQIGLVSSQSLEPRASTIPPDLPAEDAQILMLARQISEYSVASGNRVEILSDPDLALQSMRESLGKAKNFIHLEYYIIASDEVTEELFEDLMEASQRGVEVRVLYDALGSLSLKKIYFRKLSAKGVKIAGFLPITAAPSRFNFNFRNHRKILIVDGLHCFTGSANIGKQYLGKRTESQWRDYIVKVEGPVCAQLEDVFAKDWQFTTQEDLFRASYYPSSLRSGDSLVQVLESGPDTAFQSLHHALFLAINSARREILLTTPYFIPDSDVLSSLCVAAMKGVDVKILLPAKSDSRFVRWASRSFYDELLKAGAGIYEYQPQILHSKLLIIDSKWTILGSFNMDIRSFHLNFELNLLIHGESFASRASQLFQSDLDQSLNITLTDHSRRPVYQQLLENTARLLSPVL